MAKLLPMAEQVILSIGPGPNEPVSPDELGDLLKGVASEATSVEFEPTEESLWGLGAAWRPSLEQFIENLKLDIAKADKDIATLQAQRDTTFRILQNLERQLSVPEFVPQKETVLAFANHQFENALPSFPDNEIPIELIDFSKPLRTRVSTL